jgi:hypothetical protein
MMLQLGSSCSGAPLLLLAEPWSVLLRVWLGAGSLVRVLSENATTQRRVPIK